MTLPRYPLFIVSKGRAFEDSRLTYRHLEEMLVPYSIVVEASELGAYQRVARGAEVLVLPERYLEEYETCDDLGASRSRGPGAARNFAHDVSVARGFAWHWVMDDNINGFFRLNRNSKIQVADGTIFAAMEDFCSRYDNVAMAGPNYTYFAKRKQEIPAFITNTRIYSCNLIRNDVPLKWRARYNEDTDLSIRMLRAGWCTVQFNAFLQQKSATQTIKGGNTEAFYHAEGTVVKGERYARDGTKAKSKMLVDLHPDITTLVWKFGRWHHHVDYSIFRRNVLHLAAGVELDNGLDDPYGFSLREWPSGEEAHAWLERRRLSWLDARTQSSR